MAQEVIRRGNDGTRSHEETKEHGDGGEPPMDADVFILIRWGGLCVE